MSQQAQVEFERLVSASFLRYRDVLNLAEPTFEKDGFINTATLDGPGGRIVIRCGPAEYHAEIFIHTFEGKARWSLADLMMIGTVRDWILANRPNAAGRSTLETEVEYAFRLLANGLRSVGEFNWVHRS